MQRLTIKPKVLWYTSRQIMPDFSAVHNIFEIVSGLALVLIAYVAILIRKSQLEGKIEQQADASKLAANLTARDEQIASDLREHQAEDRGQFARITQAFEFQNNTLARIERKQSSPS